jgi:hypothetical protein
VITAVTTAPAAAQAEQIGQGNNCRTVAPCSHEMIKLELQVFGATGKSNLTF